MLVNNLNKYCENIHVTKINLYIQYITRQNYEENFHKDRNINPKIHMETQKTMDIQDNTE
jgi:hypothetical protein